MGLIEPHEHVKGRDFQNCRQKQKSEIYFTSKKNSMGLRNLKTEVVAGGGVGIM